MSNPFVGEIRIFAGNFAPSGWAFCDGRLVPIAENDALFNLIGTIYGGDGQVTFGLPDLRGRVPLHAGSGPGLSTLILGEMAGVENVTLTVSQLPQHSHFAGAATRAGELAQPAGAVPAVLGDVAGYGAGANQPMAAAAVQNAGSGQPHDNLPPYICLSFIIALYGIFPPRN
jgi:microcystin-dependent protein